MVRVLKKAWLRYKAFLGAALFVFCLSIIVTAAHAQTSAAPVAPAPAVNKPAVPDTTLQKEKITYEDAREISIQAQMTVSTLGDILSDISSTDNNQTSVKEFKTSTYSPNKNRVFDNKEINIEDDIDPQSTLAKPKDVTVEKYLDELDATYEKTADGSVTFSNLSVSDVKKTRYIYVRVRFDSHFGSKYSSTGATYTTREREALVRMERIGAKQWQALIMSISFYDPAIPIDNKDNNMQVTSDTSSTAVLISDDDFNKKKDAFLAQKAAEEKENQITYRSYVVAGDSAIANKQYKEALKFYGQAKDLKPLVPSLDKKLLKAEKLNAENTFTHYKSLGDKAKSERNFKEAIKDYNIAKQLNPDSGRMVDADKAAANQMQQIIDLPNNKLKSGEYKIAIEECEKVLHAHKENQNDYPELYYIQGFAYEKIAESKPDDKRDLQRALENFNLAIKYFDVYKDARLARADFYVRYNNDAASAISDYDALANNALDDSPEKPVYLVMEAKLKDKYHNTADALVDYDKAISLSKDDPTIYCDKGELQYRLGSYTDAQSTLNTAIKLNPKYTMAFYYRGLNFTAINKYDLAGADFSQAEGLNLKPEFLKHVDSISNSFFSKGQTFYEKHDFINADSSYNNALKIRNCNADAWHGKAEMRLNTGDDEIAKKDSVSALANYAESITLNSKAIACNPNFSDAHFKLGLAHHKRKEYDLAIESYNNSTKSDNGKVQAYIERGNVYLFLKKYSKAIEDYNQAMVPLQKDLELAKNSNDKSFRKITENKLSECNQLKGQAQYLSRDYPDAILSLNKAIDLLQTNSEAFYYRGLVFFEQKELSKSRNDFDDAIKIKADCRYYYANGKNHFINKDYASAITFFSQSIETDSLDALKNKRYMRGLSYFRSKKYNDAVNDFNIYGKSETSKLDTTFFLEYGEAQLFDGLDTGAMENFKHTLSLVPNHPKALYDLGCYFAKSKQFDKAMDLFQQAFLLHKLKEDDIRPMEDAFLVDFNKVKVNHSKYKELKKSGFNAN